METPERGKFPKKSDFGTGPSSSPAPWSSNKFQRKANFQQDRRKAAWDRKGKKIDDPLPMKGAARGKNNIYPKFKADFRGEELKNPVNFAMTEMKSKAKRSKRQKKPTHGKTVKGSSLEYANLGVGDDDDNDLVDVSDMLDESLEDDDNDIYEIPMLNTKKNKPLRTSNKMKVATTLPAESGLRRKGAKPRRNLDADEYDDQEVGDEQLEPVQVDDDESDLEEEGQQRIQQQENSEQERDSEEEDDELDEEEMGKRYREEIANLPLKEVRAMKEKLGIKLFNKTYFGVSEEQKKKDELRKAVKLDEIAKLGQHRPKEVSSKRPVSALREVYSQHEIKRKKKWDPRFDTRAGDFKEVCFDDNYAFLDEMKQGEKEKLRQEIVKAKKEGNDGRLEHLTKALKRMESRENTKSEQRRKMETRRELREENIERMMRGEHPVFKTKAEVRKLDMERKFEQLKADSKLDKYLQRKAKKSAGKEKKKRPIDAYGYQ